MKNPDTEMNDELRPEYDLQSLRIRRVGSGRKGDDTIVQLEPDVAEIFSTPESVNEALRFLIRITKQQSSTESIKLFSTPKANPTNHQQ